MENIHLYWKSTIAIYILVMVHYYLSRYSVRRKVEKKFQKDEYFVRVIDRSFFIKHLCPIVVALLWGCEVPNLISTYPKFGFEQYFLICLITISSLLILTICIPTFCIYTNKRVLIRNSISYITNTLRLEDEKKEYLINGFYFDDISEIKCEIIRNLKILSIYHKDKKLEVSCVKNMKKEVELMNKFKNEK